MRKFVLMAGGAIGALTAAERSKGRYMRAPDHPGDDGGFAEFEAAGEVETGKDAIESNQPEPEEKPKPGRKAAAPKSAPKAKEIEKTPAADDPGEDEDEPDEGADGEDEDEDENVPKPKQKASDRIRELNKRLRQEERLRRASDERLTALEKRVSTPAAGGGNSVDDIGAGPDPSDEKLYPLGHLDDRYIEDKLEWLATKKAAERADAVLQRQQENERNTALQKQHEVLLEKVDDLATRGSEIFDDYQESVIDAGMKGAWRLEQPTFEAAHEAENGAQILYELSQNKPEAARVANLSPIGQVKFVLERDAEIGKGKQPRRIPGAGAPPATQTRGANSRVRHSATTENLDEFERAWAADAKGK